MHKKGLCPWASNKKVLASTGGLTSGWRPLIFRCVFTGVVILEASSGRMQGVGWPVTGLEALENLSSCRAERISFLAGIVVGLIDCIMLELIYIVGPRIFVMILSNRWRLSTERGTPQVLTPPELNRVSGGLLPGMKLSGSCSWTSRALKAGLWIIAAESAAAESGCHTGKSISAHV